MHFFTNVKCISYRTLPELASYSDSIKCLLWFCSRTVKSCFHKKWRWRTRCTWYRIKLWWWKARKEFAICIQIFRLIRLILFKAILQVLIYKALYDKSYLGSKTTMTSGEWTCLISFATAPLTCSERGGSEKIKMKIYVSSGIRTLAPPVHDREVAAP